VPAFDEPGSEGSAGGEGRTRLGRSLSQAQTRAWASHEAAYLKHLEEELGLKVVRLPEKGADDRLVAATLKLMGEGVDVIAQGALQDGSGLGDRMCLFKVGKQSKQLEDGLRSTRYQARERDEGSDNFAVVSVFRAAGDCPRWHSGI